MHISQFKHNGPLSKLLQFITDKMGANTAR